MIIKDIPISERPRERLLKYGAESLSNEELLAILIRTGTKNKSAKEIALEIIKSVVSVNNLKDVSMNELLKIAGVGKVKAIEILSMLEIGKRVFLSLENDNRIVMNNPETIFENTKYLFDGKKQECFYCFYFNNKQKLIERKLLFMGTINRSIVHPREVFKNAYLLSASSIICVHNHPSGEVKPSLDDVAITKVLVEVGKLHNIPVLDHIIVGNNNYYSFSNEGKI